MLHVYGSRPWLALRTTLWCWRGAVEGLFRLWASNLIFLRQVESKHDTNFPQMSDYLLVACRGRLESSKNSVASQRRIETCLSTVKIATFSSKIDESSRVPTFMAIELGRLDHHAPTA